MPPKPLLLRLDATGEPRLAIETGLFGADTTVKLDGVRVGQIESADALRRGQSIALPDGSTVHLREHGWPLGRRLFVDRAGALLHGGVREAKLILWGAATVFTYLAAIRLLPIAFVLLPHGWVRMLGFVLGFAVAGVIVGGMVRRRPIAVHAALAVMLVQSVVFFAFVGVRYDGRLENSFVTDLLAWFFVAHARYAIETLKWPLQTANPLRW